MSVAAYGINDASQITGSASGYINGVYTQHAFLYTNGQIQDLGILAGSSSEGRAINNAGQVTGESGGVAFLYTNGQIQNLGTGYAYGINNEGQVVGSTAVYSDQYANGLAFLYSNGQRIDLGNGVAAAINDAGQIVGYDRLDPTDEVTSAVLYKNGQIYNLNDLIDPSLHNSLFLSTAVAINDQGQILANGPFGGSYLLTPVPEPSTWSLSGLALLGLGAGMRCLVIAREEQQ